MGECSLPEPLTRVAFIYQYRVRLGTVCWSGQVIPQIWKNWRRKDTTGLSAYMLLIKSQAPTSISSYVLFYV